MGDFPLAGLRVVEISQVWAGPQLCSSLGDMGAEVIRIESVFGTDFGRFSKAHRGPLRQFLELHRHPRSRDHYISINLGNPEGNALFREIVRTADVFVCNIAPRAMEKLKLTYAHVRPLRPDIVMATISAAGLTGPRKDLVGYGPSVNAVAGSDSLVGYPETGELMTSFWDPDPVMGVAGAYAVLMGIYHRQATGEGQLIDLSFFEVLTGLIGEAMLEYQMWGKLPALRGNTHPVMAPHGVYGSDGEDAWISIAVRTDEEWRGMCKAFQRPELVDDPRFRTFELRRKNRKALDALIQEWSRQRQPDDAVKLLQEHGVAAARVMSVGDAYLDPHDAYRRANIEILDPTITKDQITYGIPWRLNRTPGALRRMGQPYGQDNLRFFSTMLGIPEARVQEMMQREVLK